jgi:hypothetical protein
MRNLPSVFRTEKIRQLAENYNLIEPFRMLHPVRKDYTYIPNAAENLNRSRIDFFLLSSSLITCVTGADIGTGKLSKLFDHKPITLNTGHLRKKFDPNKIKDTILDNQIVQLVVELTIKENYINNADPESVPRFMVNNIRSELGRIFYRLNQITNLELNLVREENFDNNLQLRIAELLGEAHELSEMLPPLEFFENLPLVTPPDVFFEGLVMSVKNEVLSKQALIFKTKKHRKKVLADRIRALKEDIFLNHEEIFRLETTLTNLIEKDLRSEISNYKIFERLNQEKITPYFMKLAKADNTSSVGTDKICNDNGDAFASPTEQENYITNFYDTLYNKPIGPEQDENCVYRFLDDVADHPVVTNSKLSDQEKIELDADLHIDEFDEAVKEIKTNTSPGIDGISNRFIKKFWCFFRTPLYNYTRFCFDRGSLTENFRTAKVRLIPKKGDPKKISNWRPISLLSCFYKIISRVITRRIRSVSDKITCVGQKGYSSQKYGQEVLITLLDTIANVRKRNLTGCIVSLDIKKAFDSLSHNFMNYSLKFFNFGDKIINWINTICTNRKAAIIFDSRTGNFFSLDRGNAQGDVISPYIFNICYQILLLKIELSFQIKKINVPDPDIDLESLPAELRGADLTVSHRSKKVFAFADDCNILTTADAENLKNLSEILEFFGEISGLVCNISKTNIMQFGNVDLFWVPDPDCDFNFSDELTILGFSVNNSENNFKNNAERIFAKITNQVRIWSRYNLSIPGRIAICKTFMYSQLNYMGCVIPVPNEVLIKIEDAIHNFVSGNLRIAKSRVFLRTEAGGLGLFNVQNFLDSQTCSWVRRCRKADQDWKVRLLSAGTGNIYRINPDVWEEGQYPVLKNIAAVFAKFTGNFTKTNTNYKKAYLLNNTALTIGTRSKVSLTINDFNHITLDDPILLNRVLNLKMTDILSNGEKINKRNFSAALGRDVDAELWTKIDKVRNAAVLRYGSGSREFLPSEDLAEFFRTWKKGSRKIRNILDGKNDDFIPHNIVKYSNNTDTVIGMDEAVFLNKSWDKNYLSNDLRVFMFKLRNNTLPVNTILSHFVRDTSRNCTFCDLSFNPEIEDETPLHLFFNCTVSEQIRERFYKWVTNDENFIITRTEFFTSFKTRTNFFLLSLFVLTQIFLKFLWDCKIRKILPVFEHLKITVISETTVIMKLSKQMDKFFKNSNLNAELFDNPVLQG